MGKVTLDNTIEECVVLIGEGNPGATSVLAQLLEIPHGWLAMLDLDEHGVYGSNIWVLYKDVYGEDITKFHEAIKEHSYIKHIKNTPRWIR